MPFEAKDVVLLVALSGLLPPAFAQKVITDRPSPDSPRTTPRKTPAKTPALSRSAAAAKAAPDLRSLTADEGMAVIAAALNSHIRHTTGEDCSHLVQTIYERAGFPYDYKNSWQLYDGDAHFKRVWRPQPGDLVVWPGHVGIVVSPAGHSFFSELSSTGQDTASYNADYWRDRGRARFYRYLKPVTAEGRALLARSRHDKSVESARREKPAEAARPHPTHVRVVTNDDPAEAAHARAAGPSAAAAELADSADSVPLVNSRRPRPEEVRDVILKSQRRPDPAASADPPQPLVVFDELKVEKVRLKGDQGWAQVRLHQVGVVQAGRAEMAKRIVRAQWRLRRRDPDSWEVAPPQDALYLSRQAAVPVLVHQLAALTDNQQEPGAKATAQRASLARLLSTLLEP